MKIKRKLLFLAMLLLGVLCFMKTEVYAAGAKESALKAYGKFLSGGSIKWGYSKVSLKKCRFSLIYIDGDSVPELLLDSGSNEVSHADGSLRLYTYKGGKVRLVAELMDGFGYYEKKGVFYAFHTGTGGQEYYYHKLKSAKASYILYRRGKGYFEKVTKSRSPMYLSDTKKISKSAYKKELKKYVGSKKVKSVKNYYDNTAANRKAYLK